MLVLALLHFRRIAKVSFPFQFLPDVSTRMAPWKDLAPNDESAKWIE